MLNFACSRESVYAALVTLNLAFLPSLEERSILMGKAIPVLKGFLLGLTMILSAGLHRPKQAMGICTVAAEG